MHKTHYFDLGMTSVINLAASMGYAVSLIALFLATFNK
ncbi:hypothetical protein PANA5342_1413 [Pantoea ananatis LMG 5342]|nr:hypothetical protein PANA5342_1413 [Pantoea ananatis LMG 5342]